MYCPAGIATFPGDVEAAANVMETVVLFGLGVVAAVGVEPVGRESAVASDGLPVDVASQ